MHCRVQRGSLPWPTERRALLTVAAAMLLGLTHCGLAGSGTAITDSETGAERARRRGDRTHFPGVGLPDDGGSDGRRGRRHRHGRRATLPPGSATIADASRDTNIDASAGGRSKAASPRLVGHDPCGAVRRATCRRAVCCTCANSRGCRSRRAASSSFPGCVPAGTLRHPHLRRRAPTGPSRSQCCASFANGNLAGASCRSSCQGGDVQLSVTDAECQDHQTCTMLASIPGFKGCQVSRRHRRCFHLGPR